MKKIKHDPNLTRIKRKSVAVTARMKFCAEGMTSINKFIQAVTCQLEKQERQIEALMTENAMLRRKLKMPKRETAPNEITFVFPELNDSPVQILNRSIEEILPLEGDLDDLWSRVRSRMINTFHGNDWTTIQAPLKHNKNIYGPSWSEFKRYRNIGKLGLRMLAATFNHFGVDPDNIEQPPN